MIKHIQIAQHGKDILKCLKLAETAQAVLFSDGNKKAWIPKSVMKYCSMTRATWIAKWFNVNWKEC
jgi:uncharacterized protein